jgi:hypothetical protein
VPSRTLTLARRRTLSKLTIYPDRLTFNFQLSLPESVILDRPHLFERTTRLSPETHKRGETTIGPQDAVDQAAAAAQSPYSER